MHRDKGVHLHSVEVFQAVSDAKSMARAARRLGITQPAVSQHVARLEDLVGVQLLDRSHRPLRLTPAGEILRERTRDVIKVVDDAVQAARRTGDSPSPAIRMSVPNSFARTVIPPLYKRLQSSLRPDGVSISCDLSFDLVRRLTDRELDYIISSDPLIDLDGIEKCDVCREGYFVLVPGNYDGPVESLIDIAERLALVRFTARNATGQDIERHLRRIGISIENTMSFDSPSSVASMVAQGVGFAILTPLCLVDSGVPSNAIKCVPLPGPAFTRTLTTAWRIGQDASEAGSIVEAVRTTLRTKTQRSVARRIPEHVLRFEVLG